MEFADLPQVLRRMRLTALDRSQRVLAEELERSDSVEEAFDGFQKRRFDRCKYIVESSVAICNSQMGNGPRVNQAEATADMFRVTAEPI